MRSRAIQARSLLRLAAPHPAGSSAATGAVARRRSFSRSKNFLSTHAVAAAAAAAAATAKAGRGAAASVVASSSSSDSSNGSDSGPSSSSSSSSSSGNSGSSSGSSSTPSTCAQAKTQAASVPATATKLTKGSKPKSSATGIRAANPPPSSLSKVAWDAFFSLDRPLLQHEMLPARPKGSNSILLSAVEEAAASRGKPGFAGYFTGESVLAGLGLKDAHEQMQWRRRMKTIDTARFSQLIDGLAGVDSDKAGEAGKKEASAAKWMLSSFSPKSDRVALESAKLDEEERLKEEEEEAVQAALERGEDPEVARKLGVEADLIILGEPHGPRPEWSRGVATYLAEKGRAYEAPPAPVPVPVAVAENAVAEASAEEADTWAPKVASTVFMTDDDPNLMLSHAMVQATLPSALKWDQIVAQMEAVELQEPEKAAQGVDVSKLNAEMIADKAGSDVELDSVRRKRRKKIRKHKYKKLRKEQRAERQRMKK